jgi:prephenate dehydrogenase
MIDGMRLGVAGTGLIGGSIALRARELGAAVRVFDRDPATMERARARGAAGDVATSLIELAAHCDVLVVAMPVDATCLALGELSAAHGALPALILDVASVKRPVMAAGAGLKQFVGTHPMAGRERGGIDAADANLFAGATWAYVPHTNVALVKRVRELIGALGAHPLEIAAADHDEIVALTSHLPQLLSVVLGSELTDAQSADTRVSNLSGTGITSMLRLAASPQSVWGPIFAANARPVASRVRAFIRELEAAATALEEADISRLMAYFEKSQRVVGTPHAPVS